MRAECVGYIFATMLLAGVASAQTTHATTTAAAAAAGEIRRSSTTTASNAAGPSAMRTALSLAAVLALIVILFMAGKRFLPRRMFVQQGVGGSIQVLARTTISPKQRILLLQVGRRILVVADGGAALTTLTEITDAGEAAALIGQLQSEKPGGSFASALNGAMERFRTAQQQEQQQPRDQTPTQPDLSSMREEIEGLTKRVHRMAR